MSLSSDDYYEILGVPKTADDREIKKAFHKLSLKWHPDKNPPEKHEEATEHFKKISEAYEVLTDGERRKIYDKYGREGLRESATGAQSQGFPFEQMFGGAGGHPFASMFGGMFGGAFGTQQSRPRGGKGPSKMQELPITFQDMMNGSTKRLRISHKVRCGTCSGSGARSGKAHTSCSGCGGRGVKVRVMRMGPNQIMQQSGPCDECRGTGKRIDESDKCPACQGNKTEMRESIVNFTVEKGTKDGDQYVIANHADWLEDTDEAGDIIIVFREERREDMRREGNDLIMFYTILLSEALCGFKVPFTKHPSNESFILESTSVIKPGQRRKVEGLGFYNKDSKKCGDLIIEFTILFPDKLEAPRDELITKLLPKRKQPESMEGDIHQLVASSPASSPTQSNINEETAEEPIPPNCHIQ